MKKNILILGLIVANSIITISCVKEPQAMIEPPMIVLKFKDGKNYAENVFVILDENKSRITGYPGYKHIELKPYSTIDIYKGYYFTVPGGITYGLRTAYLDMTFEEYQFAADTLNPENMYKLIIDDDPYEEYYIDENNYFMTDYHNGNSFWLKENSKGGYDTIWSAYDTAKFHRTVDNSELEQFLKQLK